VPALAGIILPIAAYQRFFLGAAWVGGGSKRGLRAAAQQLGGKQLADCRFLRKRLRVRAVFFMEVVSKSLFLNTRLVKKHKAQCPDDPATGSLIRYKPCLIKKALSSRKISGVYGHCSDLRKPVRAFRETASVKAAKLLNAAGSTGRRPEIGSTQKMKILRESCKNGFCGFRIV